MKSIAKAILAGGFILAAQVAVADGTAFPPETHDTGPNITFQSTYADSHLDRPALASQPAQGADATAD